MTLTSGELPETILQFGAGRFLRGFVDRIVDFANAQGAAAGRVVVVQSTAGQRAELLNAQPEGFHVVVRGVADGQTIDRVDPVRSVSRALVADGEWSQVLEVARSAALKYIVTNATEAGYALDAHDRVESVPPRSMPAKLTAVLWERFRSGRGPLVLLPCELIEGNARELERIAVKLGRGWGLPAEFTDWLERECTWLENLVDCIVTPGPHDHPLAASDKLLVTAEPYMLWAITRPRSGSLPAFHHPAVLLVDDVAPYYLRKVRILNGLHTAMAAKFQPLGFSTVLEVMRNRDAVRWLRGLVFEEIVPTIAYRVEDAALFADQVFERFLNPFLAHRLTDIANNHEAKVAVRLRPSRDEYEKLFGRSPRRLAEVT